MGYVETINSVEQGGPVQVRGHPEPAPMDRIA